MSAHAEDVRRYCGKCCIEIEEKFGLLPGKWEEIAGKVARLSNGNFLHGRVFLRHILSYPATAALWQSRFDPGTMTGV